MSKTTSKYTDEQIDKAVRNEIDGWDMDTLLDYAYHERMSYYESTASEEEIGELIEEFGTAD